MSNKIQLIFSVTGTIATILGLVSVLLSLQNTSQTMTEDKSPRINHRSAEIEIHIAHNSCLSYATAEGAPSMCENSIDRELKKLEMANIVFSSPSEMDKSKTYIISLLLSPRKSKKYLFDKLKEEEMESDNIKYSNRMKASLISENKKAFEVTPVTEEIQGISTIIDSTIWKWDVTPQESGVHYLHLSLTAYLEIKGKETPFQIKTFDKIIIVRVSTVDEILDFINKSWKWLLGSLFFPLVAWYWKLRHPQKKSLQ